MRQISRFRSRPALQKGHFTSKGSGLNDEPRADLRPTEARPRGRPLSPALLILTLCLEALLNLSLLLDSRMRFCVINAFIYLGLAGRAQFLSVLRGQSNTASVKTKMCLPQHVLSWMGRYTRAKERPVPGQMKQPHLFSC